MLKFVKSNKIFFEVIIFVVLNIFLLYYFCDIDLLAMIILVSFVYVLPFSLIYINSKKNNEDVFLYTSTCKKIKVNYIKVLSYILLYVVMSSALLGFIEHTKLMYDLKALSINDNYLEILKNSNFNKTSITITNTIRFIITSCLLNPFFEEFICRGFIFKKLSKKIDMKISIIISSLIAGLFYGISSTGIDIGSIISITISGALLCVIYLKYNNLKICIISHMVINCICLLYQMFLPIWYKNLLLSNIFAVTGVELFVFLSIIYIFIKYCKKNNNLFVANYKNK